MQKIKGFKGFCARGGGKKNVGWDYKISAVKLPWKKRMEKTEGGTGEMQIYVSKKTLKAVIVFCMIMLLIIFGVIGKEFLSCRGYEKTFGKVTAVRVDMDMNGTHSRNGRTSSDRYYTCEYTAEDGTHTAEFFTILPKRKGKRVPVFYDPANPDQTMNNSVIEICVLAGMFLAVFLLFCVKGLSFEQTPQATVMRRRY